MQRCDAPIEQAKPPSLEALQAYSPGMKLQTGKSDFNAALPLFQRAIDLDPNFAAAYSGLVLAYLNLVEMRGRPIAELRSLTLPNLWATSIFKKAPDEQLTHFTSGIILSLAHRTASGWR